MKNSTRSPTNKSSTHRLKFNEKMDESSDFSDINKVLKTYRFHRQFLNLEMVNQICINSLANLNTEDLFIFATEILRKTYKIDRTTEEIKVLMKVTENMKYFKEMNQKKKHSKFQTHQKICEKIKYEYYNRGQTICHYGDESTKFFIILRGSVNVLIPKDYFVLKKEISSKDIRAFRVDRIINIVRMIRAMKDKKSKEMILNSRASSLIYDKFKKFSSVFSNIDNSNLTINEILNEIKESDQKEFKDELESADNMKLLGGIPLILINDPEKYYEEGVLKYQYIITLKAGQYFGEVGLLLKKPRAATILCKENTDFAVLESDDFKKILKTVEKNQMEDRVDFFKENLFNEMSRDNVLRLSYMFQKIKSFKGQYLYKEGEVCKFIYLIKKGEIEITQKYYLKNINNLNDNNYNSISDVLNEANKINENRLTNEKYLIMPLGNLSVGQSFGEEEIIRGSKRMYTAACISGNSTLYYLDRNQFLKILHEKPLTFRQFKLKIALKERWYAEKKWKFEKSITVFSRKKKNYSDHNHIRRFVEDIDYIDQSNEKEKKQLDVFSQTERLNNQIIRTDKISENLLSDRKIDIFNIVKNNQNTIKLLFKSPFGKEKHFKRKTIDLFDRKIYFNDEKLKHMIYNKLNKHYSKNENPSLSDRSNGNFGRNKYFKEKSNSPKKNIESKNLKIAPNTDRYELDKKIDIQKNWSFKGKSGSPKKNINYQEFFKIMSEKNKETILKRRNSANVFEKNEKINAELNNLLQVRGESQLKNRSSEGGIKNESVKTKSFHEVVVSSRHNLFRKKPENDYLYRALYFNKM